MITKPQNVQAVIDWLNKGAPEMAFSMHYSLRDLNELNDFLDDDDDEEFSPRELQKATDGSCGSVCCIAGAAAQFDGVKPTDPAYDSWGPLQDRALSYFGVKKPEDCPWMLPVFDPDYAPPRCTPQQAALALERWANQPVFNITFDPWEHPL